MNIDRFVLAFAGAVVLISLSLGVWVDQNWFFLTAFVGLNLLQSSFTSFCPLAMILRKLGLQSGVAFK
ncbi:MAG: YgaP family membrane protein [Steroidobacteraceae bacterium]